jgi:DNA-binding transcriptional MerR regulator
MNELLLIKDLSKKLDLTPKTIRFYEKEGLISKVKRRENNYRVYDDEDIKKLLFIKKARLLGMSIYEIKNIFKIRENGSVPCCEVISTLKKHRIEVKEKIKELSEFEKNLSETIDLFENNMELGKHGDFCGLIEKLFLI